MVHKIFCDQCGKDTSGDSFIINAHHCNLANQISTTLTWEVCRACLMKFLPANSKQHEIILKNIDYYLS